MFSCRASLPPSRQTLNFAAGIIRRHRIRIGSLWRKLNPGQQALLVLVCLRKGETFASLAAGFRGRHGHCLAVRGGDGRAAQDLEDPHQTPLLPLARRSASQGIHVLQLRET
jgi:hypothetical protein